ncbi:MAG: hypothetical protein QM778_28485 [Myxococcales bacterium]
MLSPTVRSCALAAWIVSTSLVAGCGVQPEQDLDMVEPLPASQATQARPEIIAFSTYSAALGTPVQVFGKHFPTQVDPQGLRPIAELVLHGVFEGHDGSVTQVQRTELLEYNARGELVLASLGPYRHPFSERRVVGTFRGEMALKFYEVTASRERGKLLSEAPSKPLVFEVQPSIFITAFKPVGARCVAPVGAALAGFPYQNLRAGGRLRRRDVSLRDAGETAALRRRAHGGGAGAGGTRRDP